MPFSARRLNISTLPAWAVNGDVDISDLLEQILDHIFFAGIDGPHPCADQGKYKMPRRDG
jgi:hypothetical protein